MQIKIILALLLGLGLQYTFGQNLISLSGRISGITNESEQTISGLNGASILAMPGKSGAISNEKGKFSFKAPDFAQYLIVSYPGYQTDSLAINGMREFEILLKKDFAADSVIIEANNSGSSIDPFKTQLSEVLNQKELLKAACCNLGESFETNASVDVQFDDALTGSKQIQLLGLAGPYSQISIESMPGIRGIASRIGLDLIPGPWISSIQISRGAGSVVNGYEGFVGQINVEWEKPQTGKKLFVNGYGNLLGRSELNVNSSQMINNKIGTTFLLHGNLRPSQIDRNGDNFLDVPRSRQINLANRWYFSNERNLQAQLGLQIVEDQKEIGQITGPIQGAFNTSQRRYWMKVGWVNPQRAGESLGFQALYLDHRQENQMSGLPSWEGGFNARQQSSYANLIYQNYIFNPNHRIRLGGNLQFDQIEEFVPQISTQFSFNEWVPGIFGEYTYRYKESLRIIAGLRGDFHNIWGFFLTPRLHFLYKPDQKTSIRISGGRGQRTANVFAENLSRLISQRELRTQNDSRYTGLAYNFSPEVGWNMGFNLSRDLKINYRPMQVRAEYFLTIFSQLNVVDMENPRFLDIYPLEGEAVAHSLLTEVKLELHRRLEIKGAYKFQRNIIDYKSGSLDRPFLPRHRAYLNGSFSSRSKWTFDFTGQFIGSQRIPFTDSNPVEFQLASSSPAYFMLHAQISKTIGKKWFVYLGGDNLLNFRQSYPILDPNGDFSFFDASLVWGPIVGRMVYAGFRFSIDQKE
ncbi:MAG: TonB-dependent receptor [Bacteroidia bacterium]|nr:TonB-dependent receptor [Bacteroidia bacterium]